jgi:hypothetical protein
MVDFYDDDKYLTFKEPRYEQVMLFSFWQLVGTMYVADCSKSNLLRLLSYIIAILSYSGHGRVVRQADTCNKYRVVLAVFNNYVCIS